MKEEKMKAAGKKPEHMTSLSGSRMVPKTHGRIKFRGCIDSLEADLIEAQVLASDLNESDILAKLGEVLDYIRSLMRAEVGETPLAPPVLFGMGADEIHRRSHDAGGRILRLPSYTQGALAVRLNTLRTKVREAELLAVEVFGPGELPPEAGLRELSPETSPREDIVLALNRLSSAFWFLYCNHTDKT